MLRFVRWTVLCCVVAAVGCGKTHFPVKGQVTFKDGRDVKVLAGGVVSLEATDPGKTVSSRGAIRDDGSFTIGTLTEDDGVPPGNYLVMVEPPALPRPAQRPKGWPPLKEKYRRGDQTPFRFEVEKKDNVLNLAVD